MLALVTRVLPIVKSSWKIVLTAVVVFGMLYLSYDYGYESSTNKHQLIIAEMNEAEEQRIKAVSERIVEQLNINTQLTKEKQEFESSQKVKQRRLEVELEKLRHEKQNQDWLSTPIPPDIVNLLQNNRVSD